MPCKGLHDNVDEFQDSLAQLHEIIQKFKNTHRILLGGDFNEDLSSQKTTKRLTSFKQFLKENPLSSTQTRNTYVGPSGVETSTIDYVVYNQSVEDKVLENRVIDNLSSNVSDRYPIL